MGDNTYSFPNHKLMKGSVNCNNANEIVPAMKKRIPNNSQKTFCMRFWFPSAIRLPIPAPVLDRRLLTS